MRAGWKLVPVMLAACGVGCGSSSDKPGGGDAGVDAPAGPPDAGIDAPPLAEVHGVATDVSYTSPTTTVSIPQDLSAYVLQAYVPDASAGGFRIIDAGRKDTGFTIPGVPAGAYYLLVVAPGDPVPHFFQTAARALDLGRLRLGRVDGPRATQPTVLTLHLTGMDPAQRTDRIFVDSFSTAGETLEFAGDGETALDPFPIDWQELGTPLLDASKGDDLFVVHQRRVPGIFPDSFLRTIVDVFSTNAVTLVDGQAASLTGVFQVPTTAGNKLYQLDPASYLEGLDVPNHQPMSIQMRIRASFNGAFSQGAPLFEINQTFRVAPQQAFDGASYLDPYPAAWPRFVFDAPVLAWTYAARGTADLATYSAVNFDRKPVGSMVQVSAPFPAPHAIKVGGAGTSRAGAVPFDGTHAVAIEWAAVVGVSHYTVTVLHLTSNGAAATLSPVATLDTMTSAAMVPAPLLRAGDSYVVAVAAIVDPTTDYAGGALRRMGFPFSQREAVTARLLFASSCGNGVTDAAYEECDAGGVATALCNPDCTKPVCGDGFANAAAGEACDDAEDSLVCNANCTPATCGDGHVSSLRAEACDDGNSKDGDGCSSSCLIEPGGHCSGEPSLCGICGNGAVEAGEACDLGFARNGLPGECCSIACQLQGPVTSCP